MKFLAVVCVLCVELSSSTPFPLDLTFGDESWRGVIIANETFQYWTRSDIAEVSLGILEPETDVLVIKVLYNTPSFSGDPTLVSGAIFVPADAATPRPIFVYSHATTPVKSGVSGAVGCNPDDIETCVALFTSSLGFYTFAPDYLFLGNDTRLPSGRHPLCYSPLLQSSCIDMVKVGMRVLSARVQPWNGQLFLMGYSEGGLTTLALHRIIQERYSGYLRVTASAPCAAPADISNAMKSFMMRPAAFPEPYFLPLMLLALNSLFNFSPTDYDVFSPPYRSAASLFDGMHTGKELNAVLPQIPIQAINESILQRVSNDSSFVLNSAFRAMDEWQWVPADPIAFVHCVRDPCVPFSISSDTAKWMSAHGAPKVTLVPIEGSMPHDVCAVPALLSGLDFLVSYVPSSARSHSFLAQNFGNLGARAASPLV